MGNLHHRNRSVSSAGLLERLSEMTVQVILFFLVGCTKNNTGGAEGEQGAIADNATLFWGELYVVDKGAGIAVVVLESVAQATFLIATDGDGAMIEIDAGIDSLESGIGGITFLVTTNDVVAHLQWDNLLVVEYVLDNYD